jgi:hypothetical protein
MFFLIYLACGLYLWLLGAAVFGRWETWRSLFRAPWLGYAVLIACLQIAHFFTALNPAFSWAFLAASSLCAGVIVALRLRNIPFAAKELPRMRWFVWSALLIGVAWLTFRPVFNITTQEIVHYDVGYYYLQTIAWTTAFPIVPGLGNLLLNLGFNQSPFLVASLFDSLGPHLWGYSLLGGVLPWIGLTFSCFALLQGLCAVFSIRKRLEPIEKAYAISLPAWVYTVLVNNISSNSPDIPSACLQIHLFLCFASFLAAAKEGQAILSEFGELISIGTLSLCVKLNSIFFVAAIGLLSVGLVLTRIGAPRLLGSKQALYATLAAAVLYLPWTARGIIISGYPLFPSTFLAAPVVWRVPKADVSHFYDITVYWGRQPYYDLAKVQSGFAWVPEWLRRIWSMTDQFARPLSLGGLWVSLSIVLAWKMGNLRQKLVRLVLLILPIAFGLVMWFFTAPDPRYLGSITWLIPLAAPLALISDISLSTAAFVAFAFCVNYFALGSMRYNTEWAWKKRAPGFPEIRRADILEGDNPFGVRLHYPSKGDQTFDAPLPSAKALHPSLKFLDETRGMKGGFRDARIDERGRESATD